MVLDNKKVLTGNNLSEYTVPLGKHSIKVIVNGPEIVNVTYTNDFYVEPIDNFTVYGYKDLENRIEKIKKFKGMSTVTIHLGEGDYNVSSDHISWSQTKSIRKLIINGNNKSIDGKSHGFFPCK